MTALTIRETIKRALFAQLQTVAGVAPADITMGESADSDGFPRLGFYDEGDAEVDRSSFGVDIRRATFTATGAVEAATDQAAEEACDALCALVVRALLADPQLGGAFDITEGETARDRGDAPDRKPSAAFGVRLQVEWHTAPGDPYTAA